ncbi:MAG: DUF177 domain-containing protein [Nitrosospira sp.]|nr:DUF177 domain-containing protein [Nitrosospira sp.]
MPERLVIDALDFANNAGAHHGKITLPELERLQDYLAADCGELQYSITGAREGNARPILRIAVQGTIKLRCQRCLDEVPYVLDLRAELLLAENEHELLRLEEDESVDCILASHATDVLALIEDEVILSLPISPRHTEGECSIGELNGDNAAGDKPLFATLAALKKFH